MKTWKKVFSTGVLALVLAGCGSSSSAQSTSSANGSYAGPFDEATGYAAAESYMYDAEDTAAAADPSPAKEAVTGEKLVYTASVNIETLNYEESVGYIRQRVKQFNGIVETENEWDNDRSWTYTDGRGRMTNRTLSMTLRIPTESFETFLNEMEGSGKITAKNQTVENISRKYNDNSIEIEALEKQQTRLLEMMDKAETVEEMILVEERLSEVQTKLNQKKSYQSGMDTDVKYSTIYLNVNEVQQYTPVDNSIQIGGYGKKLKETAEYSVKYFIYFLQEAGLVLIRILPFLLLAGLIILLIKLYRKSKGLDTRLFAKKKKEARDWKAYAEEKKAELNAKKEAEAIEQEIKDIDKNKKTES